MLLKVYLFTKITLLSQKDLVIQNADHHVEEDKINEEILDIFIQVLADGENQLELEDPYTTQKELHPVRKPESKWEDRLRRRKQEELPQELLPINKDLFIPDDPVTTCPRYKRGPSKHHFLRPNDDKSDSEDTIDKLEFEDELLEKAKSYFTSEISSDKELNMNSQRKHKQEEVVEISLSQNEVYLVDDFRAIKEVVEHTEDENDSEHVNIEESLT
ncbi:5830_t:CDS:2 [Dentiscutata heterogama]|uniref:5830_t:CDS:1 n=1 Tax=Dentiscutata heterogama TaxID=1316150 RepID=A0ACA9JYA9_9GLOM|nr:5830_t:CDS:2 [Dentiscutata heterogama]